MLEDQALINRHGLYFEEFQAGQTLVTHGRTVTEADVVNFAAFSGDWTPMHTDAVFAAQTPFGQRVAHGLIGVSIATGLAMRSGILDGTVLAFREISDWKFSLPIFIGDTIHARMTVSETRPVRRMGGGLVTLRVEIINQEDKIAQQGSWSVLVKGKDYPA